jgi:hypothetical protein
MKYTQREIFQKLERREKKFKVGDMVKINKPIHHGSFFVQKNISYSIDFPENTNHFIGEIGRIEKIMSNPYKDAVDDIIRKKMIGNKKLFYVYFIIALKDSPHFREIAIFGMLIADEIIPANEKERENFMKREEKFQSRRIAEQL